jgi:hypothetical protein
MTGMASQCTIVSLQDLSVGPSQTGLGITGAVVGKEPQLLEKESQLLFWLADDESTLVQVRFTQARH